MAEERLQKILSRAGIASRRAAEELILAGRVVVNGQVARELGTRADPRHDVIRVDDRVIAEQEELIYFVLYKPERMVTTLSDPEGRPSVGDLLKRVKARVYPVGRLDYDAEGVLLLTNDGELAHKLTHPRWGVRRTYLAKVKGEPTDEALQRMLDGVRLEDGMAKAIEATFEKRTPKNTWIKLVVAEGRHHLVKRLCEAVGHPVVRLYRSDYAGITSAGLKPGDFRPLSKGEVQSLQRAVEKEAPPPPGGRRRRKPTARPGGAAVRNPILGGARRPVRREIEEPAYEEAPQSARSWFGYDDDEPGEAPARPARGAASRFSRAGDEGGSRFSRGASASGGRGGLGRGEGAGDRGRSESFGGGGRSAAARSAPAGRGAGASRPTGGGGSRPASGGGARAGAGGSRPAGGGNARAGAGGSRPAGGGGARAAGAGGSRPAGGARGGSPRPGAAGGRPRGPARGSSREGGRGTRRR